MNFSIRDLDKKNRPRERLEELGSCYLSDSELLAIIIHSGGRNKTAVELATNLLSEFNGLDGLLKISISELKNFKNIGLAKAASIKSALELGLRIGNSVKDENQTVTKPEHIHSLLKKDMWEKDVELLYLISLDSRNKLIRKDLISTGTLNETLIHPREVYKKALQCCAASIILSHNHPSGETIPSEDDIRVTRRILNVGFEIGIPLIDHVIIYNNEFCSLKALNLLKRKYLIEKGGEENEKKNP